MGDEVLKRAAKWLSGCFSDGNGAVYRIGGDEFAAITVGITEDELLKKLETLRMVQDGDVPYSVSSSYSFVDRSEKNAVNQAFLRADAMMYASKTQKMPFGGLNKLSAPGPGGSGVSGIGKYKHLPWRLNIFPAGAKF